MNLPTTDILAIEPWFRFGFFVASILMLVFAERRWSLRPRRSIGSAGTNVALLLVNTLVVRIITATSLIGLAVTTQRAEWGVLTYVALPPWLEFVLAFVLLDASMYLQHRVFHWIPWLWRLHAVHHSDTAFDVTTGVRFHPGEILVSFAIKAATVVALGASPWAVLWFEAALSTASLFTHANVRLGHRVDTLLRAAIVTPDVHRIHHSMDRDEHNSNFGFLLLWWDRLGRTYRAHPRGDPRSMPIGLTGFRSTNEQRLLSLLKQPGSAG